MSVSMRSSRAAVSSPEFHQAFIDALETAVPADTSPFIDMGLVERWLIERIGEVENRLIEPERALELLAAEIDRTIQSNLEEREDLRRRYREITGGEYRP